MPRGGRRPGAGRKPIAGPVREARAAVASQFAGYVTEADTRAVVKLLVGEARAGERWAVELYMAYIFGKPAVKLDDSGISVILLNDLPKG